MLQGGDAVTKSKPKPVKPVLAWCLLINGKISPHCCRPRRGLIPDAWGPAIRVEIRPAPKRKTKRTKP